MDSLLRNQGVNSIEHLWDAVKRKTISCLSSSIILQGVERVVLSDW